MPFSMAESEDDKTRWGFGLERLPEPDDGDLFIDFEGHPFWRSDVGSSSSSVGWNAITTGSGNIAQSGPMTRSLRLPQPLN